MYASVERPLPVSALAGARPGFGRPGVWAWLWASVAGIATLVALVLLWYPHATPYNNYVLLADALLHGHVWVQPPGDYIDALSYEGRKYIIEGPLPGILMMPAVALFGLQANQTLLSFLLCAVSAGAGWELSRRLGVPWPSRIVLVLFLLLGTDLFFCAFLGDVWFIAHVASVCFTLLALVELAGKRRGWLVALWAICAFESRFSLVLAIPVYMYLLWDDAGPVVRRRRFVSFFAVAAVAAALWIGYNFARWGVWYDIGYTAWYHQDSAGQPTGSPFRLEYLPMQLWAFFVLWPDRVVGWPYLAPSRAGLALTFTSPALLLAFFAWRPLKLVLALWVAAILVAAPSFLYYVIGFVQFGMRHALDFEPFLFALMCLSAVRGLRWWGSVLCVYSILVGVWGVWFWITFFRQNG